MTIYMDYCASTPIDRRVLAEINRVFTEVYGNADSRMHIFGMRAKETVEKSRRAVAAVLDIDSTEVIFTSGATESNNMAILGLQEYGFESGKMHLITTSIEHKSILESMYIMQKRGFEVDIVSPNASGRISAEDLLRLVRSDTLLVSVMHVNNETGISQPIKEIGEELDKRGVLFHIDAAQSFGKLNDSLRNTRYNMLSLSGHKIQGPQGIGTLILKRNNFKRPPIKPLFFGGKQEYGYRPGTLPVPLIAGLALAAYLTDAEYNQNKLGCQAIKQRLMDAIADLPHSMNGDTDFALPGVINISFPGVDAESIFTALKDEYAFSNGSACTSDSYKPSHVLTAMGLPAETINSSLRISWGPAANVDFTPLVKYIRTQQK